MASESKEGRGLCSHCEMTELSVHDHEHPGLCCDCLDLSWGMSLAALNRERAARGAPPITKPWPVTP
jgi:hypothetical protein